MTRAREMDRQQIEEITSRALLEKGGFLAEKPRPRSGARPAPAAPKDQPDVRKDDDAWR
jgi:hypothetical protein